MLIANMSPSHVVRRAGIVPMAVPLLAEIENGNSCCFSGIDAHVVLDGRHVRDAGADAALVVDALKVSLAVGGRGALVAIRTLFRVGARAAADGDGIPIDVWVWVLVHGELLRCAMDHHAEGTEHRRSLDKHFNRYMKSITRVLIEVEEVEV